ncbi:MAG: helix-turn-helix domain-containing protein [Paraprevotella sp.]|nr:helix-turn-helix domain-containing protein [Paraprevotella sp.]
MSKILKIKNVNDYNRYLGYNDSHPLVSVIDYSEVSPIRHSLNNYSVYGLFLRDDASVELDYGCGRYDYNKGTLLCVAPGQIGGKEDNGECMSITGWALLFHPDLFHDTPLKNNLSKYPFFDYRINEALHMSGEEHDILVSLMQQLRDELRKRHDDFQDAIIVGYIEIILNFCLRFYNRQFICEKSEKSDILMKFNRLLQDYFEEEKQLSLGLPTVQYCADRLCISSNYFGDIIKKATGDTAGNYIRQYIIRRIKNELFTGKSITQAAYDLGFEYTQHLSRMFKNQTGMTPTEYCANIRKK